MRETELSRTIKDYLDARHVWNIRLNSGRVGRVYLCPRGTPDRLAVVKGRAIFIEVKTKGGKITTAQANAHADIVNAGGVVIVADSFEAFKTQFDAII